VRGGTLRGRGRWAGSTCSSHDPASSSRLSPGHRLASLTLEPMRALATTPVEELLGLPFLQPSQVNDSLHAYQLSKRGNSLPVTAEAVRWGKRASRHPVNSRGGSLQGPSPHPPTGGDSVRLTSAHRAAEARRPEGPTRPPGSGAARPIGSSPPRLPGESQERREGFSRVRRMLPPHTGGLRPGALSRRRAAPAEARTGPAPDGCADPGVGAANAGIRLRGL
jgi:hypothetical protein